SLWVAAWGLEAGLHPAVAAIKTALGLGAPMALVGTATVPARAGLGSAGALAVAVARAFGAAHVEDTAMAAERVFHENPSGIDVALAARGGVGMFRRGAGLEAVAAPPLRLAVGLSGEARSTAEQVAGVA